MYRPPNESNQALFLQEVELILTKMAENRVENFILASDLNFGNCYSKNPLLTPKALDEMAPELFESFGVRQLIDIPTRVTRTTTSLLDLVFCNNINNITSHGILPQIADHNGTFIGFHCHKEKVKTKTKIVHDYKKLDEARKRSLKQRIRRAEFPALFSVLDHDDTVHLRCVRYFLTAFNDI